jgi:polysaccharide pyruvyl transferase WcaK-like protein
MKKIRVITASRINTNNLGDIYLSRGLKNILERNNAEVDQWELLPQGYLIKKIISLLNRLKMLKIASYIHYITLRAHINYKKKPNIIIIGGGQLLLPRIHFVSAVGAWILLSKKLSIPIVAFSVGTEYITNSTIEIKDVLKELDQIYVRELYSKQVIGSILERDIPVTSDVAYGNAAIERLSYKKNDACALGLISKNSIASYNKFKNTKEYFDAAMEYVLFNKKTTVYLFSTVLADYESVEDNLRYLKSNYPNIRFVVFEVKSLESLWVLYQNVNLVISSRMHALISAQINGLEVMAIMRNEKISSYFDSNMKFGVTFQEELLDKSIKELLSSI